MQNASHLGKLQSSLITDGGKNERAEPAASPEVARLGALDTAWECFGRGDFSAAWEAAVHAMRVRPFHPEGCHLLAVIAQALQHFSLARRLAGAACGQAPGFARAQKFLADLPDREGSAPVALPALADVEKMLAGPPRLSVCLIARNEEAFLGACLDSVKGIADQVVLVDTGSTDRTVEIAREKGAEIFHFAWNDHFSEARNASLLPARGHWVLVLDADETLAFSEHEKLRAEMRDPGAIGYRMPLSNVGLEAQGCDYVPRLFRNAPGIFFTGRIHEQAFSSVVQLGRQWGLRDQLGTARITHHGYDPAVKARREKNARNLRLIELAMPERPRDIGLLANHGLELCNAGRWEEGVADYLQAHDLMFRGQIPVSPELRETILKQLAMALLHQGKHEEAVRCLQAARQSAPAGLAASLHWLLGRAQLQSARPAAAIEEFRLCIARRHLPALTPHLAEVLTGLPRLCEAACLAMLGCDPEAESAYRQALAEEPSREEISLAYARHLSARGRAVDALNCLHQLICRHPECAAAWELGGQISLGQKSLHPFALDWTGEAMKNHPVHPSLVFQRAAALLLQDQGGEAENLWACADLSQPENLAAWCLSQIAAGRPLVLPASCDRARLQAGILTWYRRLLDAGAAQTIQRVHQHLGLLADALPALANCLKAAVVEAQTATENALDS
jgi:tetratricopeptide (TPR) repeat protein